MQEKSAGFVQVQAFFVCWRVAMFPCMDDVPVPLNRSKPRLLDEVRTVMRRRNLAYSTEKTYLTWIRSYIRFHKYRRPKNLGAKEVDAYLSWLAVVRRVSPRTQSVALNALVFLYHRFFDVELGDLSFSRPPQKRQVPQVLTHDEAMLVLGHLNYPYSLMAKLMYGTGLRSIRYRNGSGVITCTGARCLSILSAR